MLLFGKKERPLAQLDSAFDKWVEGKGYLLPDRTPTDVAKRLGISSQTLHRYCLERYKEDFRSWRTRLRIEDAKRFLLEDPDAPLSLIGTRCGFRDRSNFSRQFEVVCGVKPSDWRLRNL